MYEAAIKEVYEVTSEILLLSECNMIKLMPATFLFSIVNEVKRRIISEPELNIPGNVPGSYVMCVKRENALLDAFSRRDLL